MKINIKNWLNKAGSDSYVPSVSASFSVLAGIGNYVADKKAEKEYTKYQNRQRAAAVANYKYQMQALQNRYGEEKDATAAEIQTNLIKNMQAKATAQASVASSGVSGSTIENLFADYDRAIALSTYTSKRNLQLKSLQINDNIDAARIEALNVINNMQTYNSTGWGGLFTAFGSAMQNYASMKTTLAQRQYYKGIGLKN